MRALRALKSRDIFRLCPSTYIEPTAGRALGIRNWPLAQVLCYVILSIVGRRAPLADANIKLSESLQ